MDRLRDHMILVMLGTSVQDTELSSSWAFPSSGIHAFSPAQLPSFVPSIMPGISMVPSILSVPIIEPTKAHIMPSDVPTMTPAPTYELSTLITSLNIDDEGNTEVV